MEWFNKMAARHRMDVAFPFLDRDLIAFLMAIPGEMQMLHGTHKGLLRRTMRGVVPDEILGRRDKGNFTLEVNQGVANGLATLLEIAGSGMAVDLGYVRGGMLKQTEQEIDRFRASTDDASVAWSVTEAAALEVWLRSFIAHAPEGRSVAYATSNGK
jgi:asparagine synthase (glutamine-hydrolysing)